MGLWPQEGPDPAARDPNTINEHLQGVVFDEVIAEPSADVVHSGDCVWVNSFKCFSCSLKCCYLFLTYLCGIIHAFSWGCTFACISFAHVWQVTPCYTCAAMQASCVKRFYTLVMDCILAPCCEAVSMVFKPFGKA